jgi:hypothetical protein
LENCREPEEIGEVTKEDSQNKVKKRSKETYGNMRELLGFNKKMKS